MSRTTARSSIASATPPLIAVRDSKDPGGPVLAFQPPEWDGFLSAIKTGELDLPTS